MSLYRVFHKHRGGQCSFVNTVSADNATDAIEIREAALRIVGDLGDYEVTADAIDDPDGSIERKWIERW